jgi:hypothetical protein
MQISFSLYHCVLISLVTMARTFTGSRYARAGATLSCRRFVHWGPRPPHQGPCTRAAVVGPSWPLRHGEPPGPGAAPAPPGLLVRIRAGDSTTVPAQWLGPPRPCPRRGQCRRAAEPARRGSPGGGGGGGGGRAARGGAGGGGGGARAGAARVAGGWGREPASLSRLRAPPRSRVKHLAPWTYLAESVAALAGSARAARARARAVEARAMDAAPWGTAGTGAARLRRGRRAHAGSRGRAPAAGGPCRPRREPAGPRAEAARRGPPGSTHSRTGPRPSHRQGSRARPPPRGRADRAREPPLGPAAAVWKKKT